MIEPLITTLASVVSSGCNDENFVKKTVIILSSIKQSISNANVSAQKIKLLVTSPNLNFLTHVTNELGMIYDNGTTSSSSSSLVGVRDNDTIVSKYSELLQELVSQLSEEVLEEFQTSILKGLHNKPIQNNKGLIVHKELQVHKGLRVCEGSLVRRRLCVHKGLLVHR